MLGASMKADTYATVHTQRLTTFKNTWAHNYTPGLTHPTLLDDTVGVWIENTAYIPPRITLFSVTL